MKKKKSTKTIDAEATKDSVNAADVSQDRNQDISSAEESSGVESSDPVVVLQQKVDQLQDNLLRAKADFQNLQRRSAIERSEAIQYANADLMKSLVTVVDDFERSFQALESSDQDTSQADGFRLIYDNLKKSLVQFGLETINALHQPFDPTIHDALLQQPSNEHHPGTVIEEISKGYRLRDRVIRPSRVIVSKAAESQDEVQKATEPQDAGDPPAPRE